MSALILCVWFFFDFVSAALTGLTRSYDLGDSAAVQTLGRFCLFFFLPLVEQQYLVKMWKCHKKVATMSFTEVPGLKRLSPSQDSDHSPFPTAEKNLPSWSHIQFFLLQNLKRCGINENSQIPRACADDWQQACQLPLMFLHGQIFSQQFLHAYIPNQRCALLRSGAISFCFLCSTAMIILSFLSTVSLVLLPLGIALALGLCFWFLVL